jgi:serine protease Do
MKLKKLVGLFLSTIVLAGCTTTQSNDLKFRDPIPLVRKLQEQTVFLDTGSSTSSGVVIYQDDDTAYILTDRHCVLDNDNNVVRKIDVRKIIHYGDIAFDQFTEKGDVVLISDKNLDLALIRYDVYNYGKFKSVASLQERINLPVGTKTIHCGNTFHIVGFYSEGVISSYFQREGHLFMYLTTIADHGSSGGGMYDEHGNLIGMPQFIIKEKIGASITINEACRWLKDNHYGFLVK